MSDPVIQKPTTWPMPSDVTDEEATPANKEARDREAARVKAQADAEMERQRKHEETERRQSQADAQEKQAVEQAAARQRIAEANKVQRDVERMRQEGAYTLEAQMKAAQARAQGEAKLYAEEGQELRQPDQHELQALRQELQQFQEEVQAYKAFREQRPEAPPPQPDSQVQAPGAMTLSQLYGHIEALGRERTAFNKEALATELSAVIKAVQTAIRDKTTDYAEMACMLVMALDDIALATT